MSSSARDAEALSGPTQRRLHQVRAYGEGKRPGMRLLGAGIVSTLEICYSSSQPYSSFRVAAALSASASSGSC